MDRNNDMRYGVQLIDDIHRYFPALLYDNRRFLSLRDVFTYVNQQMDTNFNLYNQGSVRYREANRANVRPVQQPPPRVDIRAVQPTLQPSLQRQDTALNYSIDPLTSPFVNTSPFNTTLFRTSLPLANLAVLQALFEGDSMEEPDDVIVAPTQEQINFGTTVYNIGTTENLENRVCAVCQDGFVESQSVRRITGCNHEFHRGCIDTWFQRNVHCPVCRYDIRDISSQESTA